MIGSSKVLNNIIVYDPAYDYDLQSICPCGFKINLSDYYCKIHYRGVMVNARKYYYKEYGLIDIVPMILDKNYRIYEFSIFDDGYLILFSKKDTWVIDKAIEGFESCPAIKIEKTGDKWLKIYRGWNEIDNLIYLCKTSHSDKYKAKKIFVKYGERIFDLINIIYLIEEIIVILDKYEDYDYDYDLSDGDVLIVDGSLISGNALIVDEEQLKEEILNKLSPYDLPILPPYISGEYYDNRIFKLITYYNIYEDSLGSTYLLFFEDLDCLVAVASTEYGIIIVLHYEGKCRVYILYYLGIDIDTDMFMVDKQGDDILIYFQFTNGKENCFKIKIQDLIKNIDIENKEYYYIGNKMKFLKCDINDIAKPLNPLKDGVCLVFSRGNYRDYRVGYHNIYLHKGEFITYEIFDMPSKITTYNYFVNFACLDPYSYTEYTEEDEEMKALDFTYITPKYI